MSYSLSTLSQFNYYYRQTTKYLYVVVRDAKLPVLIKLTQTDDVAAST